MKENRSKTSASKTKIYVANEAVATRLDEIADIENVPQECILEKLIMDYVPVKPPQVGGKLRYVYMSSVRRLRKLRPRAIVVSVAMRGKLSLPLQAYRDFHAGKITWDEYKRMCVERLMLPDAQAEIVRLKKLLQTQDIYLASFEKNEEYSYRKLVVDYIEGKLIWK